MSACNCASYGNAYSCPVHTQADYEAQGAIRATPPSPAAEGNAPLLLQIAAEIHALPRWDKRSVPGGMHVRLADVEAILTRALADAASTPEATWHWRSDPPHDIDEWCSQCVGLPEDEHDTDAPQFAACEVRSTPESKTSKTQRTGSAPSSRLRKEVMIALSFDDVMIAPNHSDIAHRTEIDISQNFLGIDLKVPIISANMSSITESWMAAAMTSVGAFYVLHRFFPTNRDMEITLQNLARTHDFPLSYSAGIRDPEKEIEKYERLVDQYGHDRLYVTIDTAHGDHQRVIDLVTALKDAGAKHVIAGNVATADGYFELALAGADAVKVGIGGGAICTTREKTGVGVPQLFAVQQAAAEREFMEPENRALIISDGGHKAIGDVAKALAAGADAVMLGSMLAGTDETPSERRIDRDGKVYREYNGQSIFGTNRDNYTVEGVRGFVPERGPVGDVVRDIAGGITSALSYVGARNLTEFRQKATFIEVSPSSHLESGTRVRREL